MIAEQYRASSDNPYHISAGGVVYAFEDNEPLFAVLYRERDNKRTYHLPKGMVNLEEPLLQAAIREVEEEAGLHVEPVHYIGATTRRWTHPRKNIVVDKTSHYFLFKAVEDTKEGMDEEHDGLMWVTASEAKKLLYEMPKDEAKFIDRALKYLE